MLSLDEIDSHTLAHAIENEDVDPHTVADDLYYEELRATYGFTARKRSTGRCFICGQAGHWVPECPHNPDNIVAQTRIIPEPTGTTVAAAQLPDPQFQKPPFDPAEMLRLLGQCTQKQNVPKEVSKCTTLLSGTVVHFGGQRIDSGWGCGYRNIQMLAAHLIATNQHSANALFSGSRFVPDIPSLQAWIEVAWRAGFDAVGAEQLDRNLQGGKKWIGTTEAAVLFRYFGIPAVIIDFGAMRSRENGNNNSSKLGSQQQMLHERHQLKITSFTSPTVAAEDKEKEDNDKEEKDEDKNDEVHENVECDVCGCFPIVGERLKSQVLPNYDVCTQCILNNPEINAAAGPFSRISTSLAHNNHYLVSKRPKGMSPYTGNPLQQGVVGGGRTQAYKRNDVHSKTECSPAGKSLLNWVWEYFSQVDFAATDQDKNQPSTSSALEAQPPPSSPPTHPPRLHLSRGGPGWKVETHYTCRCPLYLQHEGHSRTIIGVERKQRRDGTFEIALLMLDPGVPPPALQDALAAGTKWQRLLKRSASTLNKSQYQILYCPDGEVPFLPGSPLYESLKILRAEKND
jgi:hypothetical protein